MFDRVLFYRNITGQEVSVYFNGQPNARENYTIMCNVSLADGEQENNLTVEWLAPSGSVVESDNGTTQIIYTFNPLLPSHGGEYRCRATLLQGDQVLLLGEDTVNVIVSGLSGKLSDCTCVEQYNMHSTVVPPPEVTSKYEGVPAGYVLWCYVKLIEDTPLLVDGLTIEWFNQSDGSSLKKRSGTNLNKDSSGARQLGIEHKPQMTSDGGSYTCQALLQGNMFITPQQPVTNETYTVTVKSRHVTRNKYVLCTKMNVIFYTVPTPSVTIVEPSGTLYVGDGLQCQVEISDSVDTPVDVNYTWKNESGEVVSSGVADGSVTIELSVSTGGSYSCEAMVIPSGSTEFILPSGIGINTLYIEVG